MTKETRTVMEPHLLRLSPPPSASPSSMTPSCDSHLEEEEEEATSTCTRTSLVDVENTPPPPASSPALSPRDTSPYHRSPKAYHPCHHPHHLHHHHHHHLPQRPSLSPPQPQQNSWSSPLTLESSTGEVVVLNHPLPLSPSMTPPIVLSPTGGSDLAESEDDEIEQEHTPTSTSASDSVVNSPLSLASDDDYEELVEVGVEGTMPDQQQQATLKQSTSPEKSPSPRLTRSSRPGSLRHARSSARFKPYKSSPSRANAATVLRPLNDGDRLGTSLALSSSTTTSSLCDTISTTTDDEVPTLTLDFNSRTMSTTSTSVSRTTSSNASSGLSQQLSIDTALANSQSAAAHQQSRAAKLALVEKLISVIDDDDFERFRAILRQSKQPDLNVFVNGQTALHHALLRGRDVSWCKQLVLFGANPNLSNLDGWHPLHLATFGGHNDNLNYLISCNINNGQQVK